MPFICIDFGGTKVKYGIINPGGEIKAYASIDAVAGDRMENNLQRVNQAIKDLLNKHAIPFEQIMGIGIALPSIVDDQNHVLSRYTKYGDANDLDFNAWALREWGVPIILENDARAALMGEWKYGAGIGYNNLALLTLGTGIGSAILSEGKLYKGRHFLAGSLSGHISIRFDGETCNCGFTGCAETVASTWALPGIAAKHSLYTESSLSRIQHLDYKQVFAESENGDQLARLLMDNTLKAWGTVVVNLVHAHDPELIIVGGGIMKSQDKILPYLQAMIDNYSWLPAGTIKVCAASQPDFAGILGMEYLVNSSLK